MIQRDATMRYYQFQAFICLENWEEAKKELDTTLKASLLSPFLLFS